MSRLKTLSVLGGIIAALAVSATPAFAEFESTAKPAQKQGEVKILKEGVLKDGGLEVVCPKAEIKAQYHILKGGQIKQQQEETTRESSLALQVKNWGAKCVAKVAKTEFTATITGCSLQWAQRIKKEASGGISEGCLMAIGEKAKPLCELQVPAGMETSVENGEGINVGLKATVLENSGSNGIFKANIEGGGKGQGSGKIFIVQIPGHVLCTIKTNEEGVISGLEAEMVGLSTGPTPTFSSPEATYPYEYKETDSEPEVLTLGKDNLRCKSKDANKISEAEIMLETEPSDEGCELEEGGVKEGGAVVGLSACSLGYSQPSFKTIENNIITEGKWGVVLGFPSGLCKVSIKNGANTCEVNIARHIAERAATWVNTPKGMTFTGSTAKIAMGNIGWATITGSCTGFSASGTGGKYERKWTSTYIVTAAD